MFPENLISAIVLGYLLALFLIASYGDNIFKRLSRRYRNLIYGLSLSVYCSSWTFLGAAGSAAKTGWDYFAIFLGPILLFTLGLRVVRKIVVISKQQNITTVSDFISTRYGSNRQIATIITTIAVIGALPYIGLQLKAVGMAYDIATTTQSNIANFTPQPSSSFLADPAFFTALILIWFTIIFGTRNYDATEHHKGVVSAIAFESVIKLIAILVVGYFAVSTYVDFSGRGIRIPTDLAFLSNAPNQFELFDFIIKTMLSLFAAILLPRQFHVGVNEAENDIQVTQSAKYFIIYLLIFSLVIPPITLAGITTLSGSSNTDLFVLSLPIANDNQLISILAYLGTISAATGMVIVTSIAISTMVCNDIALPWLLKLQQHTRFFGDIPSMIIITRRIIIAVVILLSYGYYNSTDGTKALANIGLVSFAATAQFAPAMVAALYWRGSNAFGVKLGLALGFMVWVYTLLVPTLLSDSAAERFFPETPWLDPNTLFGLNFSSSLAHGVVWSLLFNTLGLMLGSFFTKNKRIESIQANNFVDAQLSQGIRENRTFINASYNAGRALCEQIIGNRQTRKLFSVLHQHATFEEGDAIKNIHLQDIERSLAAVVGNPTAKQLVRQALIDNPSESDTNIVEQTTRASRFSYSILQSTLENIGEAVSVVDNNQNLIAWNTRYVEMFNYPDSLMRIGTPILNILQHNAEKGHLRDLDPEAEIKTRFQNFVRGTPFSVERKLDNGKFIRIFGNPIPNGGFVTSYTDITELKTVEKQLEIRVNQRTRELEKLTESLKMATEDKTHFLAAASHDLLQPINAARLFAYGLKNDDLSSEERAETADKVDQALVSADNILRTLLNISQLDRGTIKPNIKPILIADLIAEVTNDASARANEKGIKIIHYPSQAVINSDYQLLFSVLQNIISNAVRYTNAGSVTVSCKRKFSKLLIEISDTGIGIAETDQHKIFEEFSRGSNTESANSIGKGVGLGLSIVKRICDLLGHNIHFQSKLKKGTRFFIEVPVSHKNANASGKTNAVEQEQDDLSRLTELNVLCLDNDLEALQGLKSILSSWGCNALVCSNLEEAVEILEEDTIDIVLADYQLDNDEYGLDLLQQLKDQQIETHKQPALMLLTATQDDKLFEKCDQQEIAYLHKPINPESLKNWLLLLDQKLNETSA